MERSTVLPPLLHAVLDLRDSVQWGDPRTVSPKITMRHEVNPIGGSPVVRYTMTVPDVHASVMALFFRPDFDAHLQASAQENSCFLGTVDAGAVNRAAGSVPTPSLTRTARSGVRRPHTGESSTSQVAPSSTVERLLVCPDTWFRPSVDKAREVEECVLVGGGVTDQLPSCPDGFPNAHPSDCLASADEALVYFYFGLPLPASKPRDFVCRAVGMHDLCADDTSPLQSLRRDAAGICSGHRVAYATAVCSCSGALPALKRHVRGGAVCSIVIEGMDKGTPGLVMDSFVGLDLGVKSPIGLLESLHDRDMKNFVSLARKVGPLFNGEPIDVSDNEAMKSALAVVARERVRHGVAAADVGCESGLCVLQ